jgi:hypothetical protein
MIKLPRNVVSKSHTMLSRKALTSTNRRIFVSVGGCGRSDFIVEISLLDYSLMD